MSTRNKLLVPILVLTMLVVAGTVAAYQTFGGMGTLVIDVQEKHPGGDAVFMRIPGALIPVTLNCIPNGSFHCGGSDEDLRYVGPILMTISKELRKMPDAVIVQVESPDEVVVIEKRGGYLIIDVDTPDETVHISMPLKAVEMIAKKMDGVIRYST
jgi:hypothetical protein